MKLIKILFVFSWLAALSACSDQSFVRPDFNLFNKTPDSFSGVLKEEYKNFVEFETQYFANSPRIELFNDKSRKTSSSLPEDPANYEIPAGDRPQLMRAYKSLLDALNNKQIPENEVLLAMAQTRFDCWVVYMAEFKVQNAYSKCKNDFYTAISYLKTPKEEIILPEGQYNVFFESNSTALDKEAMKIVRSAAAKFQRNKSYRILLNGLTDSKGNKYANKILSMRRAVAVKNALAQNGVDLNQISINALGEQSARNQDSEANSASSRRVEIIFQKTGAKPKGFLKNISDSPEWQHSATEL